MEKSTKALLALALLFIAFIVSTEEARDVPGKEVANTDGPLHTQTFGLFSPWAWWGRGGGWNQGGGYGVGSGGPGGLGGFISWLAGHPWFAGHPWLGRLGGYGYGGGIPIPWKTFNQDDAKKSDTPKTNNGTGSKHP